MKKLIAMPDTVIVNYDLSTDDVVRVATQETDDTFTVIAKCGLAIEEYLLKDSMNTLYNDPLRYSLAGIIWKTPLGDFVDESLPWLQNIRGDELLFPSLHFEQDNSWVVGNPRALIKWAACCVNLNMSDVAPAFRFSERSDQIWLPWLGHRIGLKVYGQSI